jgi:hypothetical protein
MGTISADAEIAPGDHFAAICREGSKEERSVRYPHLHLTDWPFRIVPDESYCTFMADRKQVVQDISSMLRNLSRRDASTIHILWAWYGAGKTHTLRHIAHLCNTQYPSLVPVYNEFPRGTRSFLNLYAAFVSGLDLEFVQDAYLEVFTSPKKEEAQRELEREFPDLSNALKMLCMGKQRQIATANFWLRGEKVPLRDLRSIDISSRIETAEQALQVITWLLRLFNWASAQGESAVCRILWMIDEFQRIDQCRRPAQQEINGCLSSMFNRCPRSFSLFLSFSGPPSKKMPSWLSKELADRIGIERVMLLPPLISDEANIFICDVLKHFRDTSSSSVPPTFPFTDEAVEAVIDIVRSKSELKPRSILQTCNAVLEEADLKIEDGAMSVIDAQFVQNVLKDRVFLETEGSE